MRASSASWWVTTPILVVLFFGGGFAGVQLAHRLAPQSASAEFLSFLALPLAYVLGTISWLGAAAIRALTRSVRSGGRRFGASGGKADRDGSAIPPGAGAFVPAAVMPCGIVGVLVGMLSDEFGFARVLAVYMGLGLVYGVICWKLAEAGYLPFPNE